MASLRSVVAQIQRVSNQADGERLPSLHPSLLELEDVLGSRGNENSVKLNVEEIVDALRTLDVRQHQLGYLWLLEHRMRECLGDAVDREALELTFLFLTSLKPGDYVGESDLGRNVLTKLCCEITQLAIQFDCTKHAIYPLMCCVRCACDDNMHWITPIHGKLLQLCLLSKCYSVAASHLLPKAPAGLVRHPKQFCLQLSDVLLYYYYGGMVFTGLKKYAQALEMYLLCLVLPVTASQAISVEAMKKYILISLILYGEIKMLPSYVPTVITKTMRTDCEEYMELARKVQEASSIENFIQDKSEIWRRDGNFGLVTIIKDLEKQRKLIDLGRVYTCCPIKKMQCDLGLGDNDSVDNHILRMDRSLTIQPEIDAKEQVVHFDQKIVSNSSVDSLLNIIEDCVRARDEIDQENHRLECSHDFIAVLLNTKKSFSAKQDQSSGPSRDDEALASLLG